VVAMDTNRFSRDTMLKSRIPEKTRHKNGINAVLEISVN